MLSLYFAVADDGAVSKNSQSVAKSKKAHPPDLVWIVRSDGSKSCDPHSAQAVEEGAKDLQEAGITVHQSLKANDGNMHAQFCGADTGSLNAYRIDKKDLDKARKKGFDMTKSDLQSH